MTTPVRNPRARIVGDRLRQVADRVLWLEAGTFRELIGMVADAVCGMAVEPPPTPTTSTPT